MPQSQCSAPHPHMFCQFVVLLPLFSPNQVSGNNRCVGKTGCCTCNSSTAVVVMIAVLALMFFFSFFLKLLFNVLFFCKLSQVQTKKERREESGEWCHIARGLFWGVSCSLALFNSFTLKHRDGRAFFNKTWKVGTDSSKRTHRHKNRPDTITYWDWASRQLRTSGTNSALWKETLFTVEIK